MKIGFAKDIHNLIKLANKPLVLGGYVIHNHIYSIQAVSDGDVILHSITSAILGALGLKTLGEYFPDTDIHNAKRSSLDFMHFALQAMHDQNMHIESLDLCIVCEQIMLKDHLEQIKKSLQTILENDSIGIKCTRFENKTNFTIESNCCILLNKV